MIRFVKQHFGFGLWFGAAVLQRVLLAGARKLQKSLRRLLQRPAQTSPNCRSAGRTHPMTGRERGPNHDAVPGLQANVGLAPRYLHGGSQAEAQKHAPFWAKSGI